MIMCNCARASVFCAEIVPTLAMALINKSNVCVCPYVYELSARECMLLVIYTRGTTTRAADMRARRTPAKC
jgi:hypothetical protein